MSNEDKGITRRGFFSQTLVAVPTISLAVILAAEPANASGDGGGREHDDDDDD